MTLRKLGLSLLILILAVALATWLRARTRETAAEAAYPPSGQIVTVDGQRMHVRVEGDGPDVVLIHGSSGSIRDFTFTLMPLLAKRYRVFAVDRPGLGWSEMAPGAEHLDRQAALIAAAASAAGAENPIVLGQSYGGSVALGWAVTRPAPLSALVLVSTPSHPWDSGLGTFYTVLSHPLGQAIVAPLLTAWVPNAKVMSELAEAYAPQPLPDGYAAHFGPAMSLRRSALRANARQRAALLDDITGMVRHYPTLELPIETLHGSADTTVGLSIHAEKLAADNPNVALTPLPGIGHMPHHVAAQAVVDAVDRAAARAGLH